MNSAARSDVLTTGAVSTASGYSAQQIRDLEAQGVIPPARRAPNGYREFHGEHVRALRAYRNLAAALDPARARRTLRQVRTLPRDQAAALINSWHTTLAKQRDDALAAQRAIALIRADATNEAVPSSADTMTVTELADALGVRSSTLRFWEKAGLFVPERVTSRAGATRRYPVQVVREARIVTTLRAAGYRIPEVQEAMRAIRRLEGIEEPLRALQARIDVLAQRMLALLRAGTDIAELLAPG